MIKLLQLTIWSGNRVQVSSQVRALHVWPSLQKAFPEGNQMFCGRSMSVSRYSLGWSQWSDRRAQPHLCQGQWQLLLAVRGSKSLAFGKKCGCCGPSHDTESVAQLKPTLRIKMVLMLCKFTTIVFVGSIESVTDSRSAHCLPQSFPIKNVKLKVKQKPALKNSSSWIQLAYCNTDGTRPWCFWVTAQGNFLRLKWISTRLPMTIITIIFSVSVPMPPPTSWS